MTSAESARPALRRDSRRRMLLGVCSGIARSLDADPALVRGAAILIGLVAGPLALVAYFGTAAIVPRDDGRMLLGGHPSDRRETWLGWAGIVVACLILLAAAPGFDSVFFDHPFASPLLVVALGAIVWTLVRANHDRVEPVGAAPVPPVAPGGPETPEATRTDLAADQPTGPTAALAAPVAPTTAVHAPRPGAGGATTATAVQPPRPPAPAGRSLFLTVTGVLAAAAGVVVVLEALGVVDLSAQAVAVLLGVGALAAGGAAALGAGRRGIGATLAVGIVLALAAVSVAAVADEVDRGVGVRTIRPASAADLRPEYRLGMGLLELDLRHTALPPGSTTVRANVDFGEVLLRVPAGVRVESVGPDTAGGDLEPTSRPASKPARRSGTKAAKGAKAQRRPSATPAPPVIRLDADVRAGDVRVQRG